MTVPEYEDQFWANMKAGVSDSSVPSYATDNQISMFEKSTKYWNLNKFTTRESLIHQDDAPLLFGILTPCVYFGAAYTFFAYHIEDGDLCSINYLHSGKPKVNIHISQFFIICLIVLFILLFTFLKL